MELIFNILLIGDPCSGKTELVFKYTDGYLPESLISTIGVEFKEKRIKIGKFNITIMMWDTIGQERYRTLTQSFLRNADGFLFIYDIAKKNSFFHIKDWIRDVQFSGIELYSIICGNRVDLEDKREVSFDSLKEYGLRVNMPTFEISSKTGYNINEAFEKLVYLIMENKTDEELIILYGQKQQSISLKDYDKQKRKKKYKKKEENKTNNKN